MSAILECVSFAQILAQADSGSLARGRDYADRGLVRIVSRSESSVSAIASGTDEYDVSLRHQQGFCTCPVGLRGDVCKHQVAAASSPTAEGAGRANRLTSGRLNRPDVLAAASPGRRSVTSSRR